MRSITIIQDYSQLAREAFTVFALAILFLVTGCSNGDYSPRVELAPAPPFMAHPQSYGPPLPYEIAMLQAMDDIQPAAGGHETFGPVQQACATRRGFSQGESHFGFGHNGSLQSDHELSFSRTHSNADAPGMMIRLSVALPTPVKKRSCN